MVTTLEHLRTTQSALADLEAGLARLRRERDSMHQDWFRVFAQPYADMIRQLRAQIDEYTGLSDPLLAETPDDETQANGVNGVAEHSKPAETA